MRGQSPGRVRGCGDPRDFSRATPCRERRMHAILLRLRFRVLYDCTPLVPNPDFPAWAQSAKLRGVCIPAMKAKACARCRQSKLRCDSDVKAPDACSRCQSINRPCVSDRSFQYTSKSRRLQELEAEVKRLREAVVTANSTALPGLGQQSQQLTDFTLAPQCLLDKSLGNVHLAAAQVTELFRVYFTQCHPYLPFSISTTPETIYEACPLLFWVICSVASSTDIMLELQPHIQAMIGQVVVNPPRSVEVIQSLLILCMWPFPFYSTLGDPSFLYCGIATQMALQLGLHRPSLTPEFSSRRQVLEVADDVRKTTWMACYVVKQMQAGRLGVPDSIPTDFTFLRALETPEVHPWLAFAA